MIPMGAFDPLEPALILPDVKNPKTWRGGAIEFLDPGKTVIVMTPFQRGTIFYNTKLVNAKEFKSYKDLLDPKWKGKMVVDDPRRARTWTVRLSLSFIFTRSWARISFARWASNS